MSGQDHLNPQQFMTAEQIGKAESQYGPRGHRLTAGEAYHSPERFDEVSDNGAIGHGYADAHEYHQALTEDIRQHGIREPLAVQTDWRVPQLSNGHHRYFAGLDAGLTKFPVKYIDRHGDEIRQDREAGS